MTVQDTRARLILLGASNVTRGIGTVVETAHVLLGAPLDIYIAAGLGRSYGTRSSVFFGLRSLPGILECGLWEALAKHDHTPGLTEGETRGTAPPDAQSGSSSASLRQPRRASTYALITDIGNDIMYGASPQTITGWVEECIERLQLHEAQITMTMLPIRTIRAVRRWQYAVVKSVMFPTRELKYDQAIERANELHDLIMELAQRRGVQLLETDPAWYGFDPIHVRLRHWPEVWCRILGACARLDATGDRRATPSLLRSIRMRSMTPQRWWLGPVERGRPEPVSRLHNGTRIWMY